MSSVQQKAKILSTPMHNTCLPYTQFSNDCDDASSSQLWVASLYYFCQLPHYKSLRQPLLHLLEQHHIKGSVLLAQEGINASLSGTKVALNHIVCWLRHTLSNDSLQARYSPTQVNPFYRAKVKIKQEIVTMGKMNTPFCPGVRVKAHDWNNLILDPQTLLIDTRNDYEFHIGAFVGAINPKLDNFRQFPQYFTANIQNLFPAKIYPSLANQSNRKNTYTRLAMYCTGGIRCEKATSLAKAAGLDEVYHLEGGILAYLAEIAPQDSLWEGDCFVFDNRVALRTGLRQGSFHQCHACRYPIDTKLMESKLYIPGVQCPLCAHSRSNAQRQRAAERARQITLAKAQGNTHLGANISKAKQAKYASKKNNLSNNGNTHIF